MAKKLKLMVIGAHPDDCDIFAGGLTLRYAASGNDVLFVSLTNGSAGHQKMGGANLAVTRYNEAQAVAKLAGITYHMFDYDDAYLEPTLEARRQLVEEIRKFEPDLIITNRPNDYHPDHRATAQLVMDASYMVMVPNFCKLTQPLRYNPVIAYAYDSFEYPRPFRTDVAIDVSELEGKMLSLMDCHKSQMYDWLPWIDDIKKPIPKDDAGRLKFIRDWIAPTYEGALKMAKPKLAGIYGKEKADACTLAEVYEISEYGGTLTKEKAKELFML